MKLRTGLLVLAGGTVVPVFLLAIVLGLLLIDHERETFRRGAVDRNRALLSAVDANLEGHVATVKALAASASLEEGDLARFRVRAARVLASQPDWLDVTVSNPEGVRVMALAFADRLGPVVDRESLERAIATRMPAIGNIVPREPAGDYGFAVRYPVVQGGTVAYVVSAIVSPAPFARLIQAQGLKPDWVSGLIDATGHFVARVPPRPHSDIASEDFRRQIAGSREGWYRGLTVDGFDTFTAHGTSARSGWSIGLAIPSDQVMASARRASWTLAMGTVLAVLLAFGFAWLAGRRIASPMARAATAARALGQGERAVLPGPRSSVEEIADVERALEDAGASIAERQALRDREQAAMRDADRAKDEFIAILGHELRNPLSAISNSAHLLREVRAGSQADTLAREIIERQARQMARLVDDLMDMSRLTMGKLQLKREPVDLAHVASQLIETWSRTRRLAADRVHLEIEPVPMVADRARIEQVVANLLDNAVKFSPERKPIRVRVHREGSQGVVEVADEGDGIAPEMLERVFRPFVQAPQDAHRPSGGLGLGLSVAKRLVELHGGSIAARSPGPGLGSTFIVKLPIEEPARPPHKPEREASAAGRLAV